MDVQVKDHRGEPVGNSEVAVVIVDESVLALSGYSIADPAATSTRLDLPERRIIIRERI